ncbi:MAG: hypothetical protein KJP21_05905 [Bacteroidia bacterium]|nr:hypothetical protein [Bacteroidia bacterium]NNJ55813.1 hypothetical protein [Bacteroidia bacterium]
MRVFLGFIFLFSFAFSFAQRGIYKAQFKSLYNGEEILYAKIANSNGEARLSNINGFVSIPYEKGEELVVTHLTFDTLFINTNDVKADTNLFYLRPRVYVMQEFTVSVLGPRVLFDRKFVKNDLGKSDEEKVREKLKIIDMRMELINLDKSAQSGAVLGSPITHLYERYSKAGRERQKYAYLLEKDKQNAKAGKIYDDIVVRALTSYDDDELQRFKEFCSFHPSYIAAVDALTLYYEIIRCKKEYIEKEY